MFWTWISVLTIAAVLGGCTPDTPPTRPNVSEPVTQQTFNLESNPVGALQRARFFAFGGVGFTGTVSEGEQAFHLAMASTNPVECFNTVLTNGTPEAKLYALCGIQKLMPSKFEEAARLIDNNINVQTMRGCSYGSNPMSEVIASIRNGEYSYHQSYRETEILVPLKKPQLITSNTIGGVTSPTNAPLSRPKHLHPSYSLDETQSLADKYIKTSALDLRGYRIESAYYSLCEDQANNGWTFIWMPIEKTFVFDDEVRIYVNDDGTVIHGGGS